MSQFINEELGNYEPEVSPQVWANILSERKKRRPKAVWWNFSDNATLLSLLIILLFSGSIASLVILHNSGIKKERNINNGFLHENSRISAINKINNANQSSLLVQNNFIQKGNKENPNFSSAANTNSSSYLSTIVSNNNIELNNVNFIYKKINNYSENNINRNEPFDNDVNQAGNTESILIPMRLPNILAEMPDYSMANSSLQRKVTSTIKAPECPTFYHNVLGNKRYIEIYFGPDYGIRTLTDTANPKYLQQREATSKFSSAFSAGIRYARVFENGISIHAGVSYSQINEKFSFIEGNVVQVTYTINPVTGDTTGSYTVRGTRYTTSYNHYRNIDIPLTAGYEFGSEKLYADASAGPIINIYSWQSGTVLDTNDQPIDITTGKSASSPYQFKTNVGVGLTGSIAVHYKLNDNLDVFGEPYFRYNFQPMSSNSLSLREKYSTIGLHLGVRMNLHY